MTIVNWTSRAVNALEGIFEYINREAPFYAEHTVQQILASVDRLEAHPFSGRVVPEAEQDDIREVIFQHYRIIYWIVSSNQIDILGVVHGSRDLSNPDNQPWNS